MRLKGRENTATVKLTQRIAEAAAVPRRRYGGFWGKNHAGMVVGFKGKAGTGTITVYFKYVFYSFYGGRSILQCTEK